MTKKVIKKINEQFKKAISYLDYTIRQYNPKRYKDINNK